MVRHATVRGDVVAWLGKKGCDLSSIRRFSLVVGLTLATTVGGIGTQAMAQPSPQLVSLSVYSNAAGGVNTSVPAGSTGPWSFGNSVVQTWQANENGQLVQWPVEESYALSASISVTGDTWTIRSNAAFSRLALQTPVAVEFGDVTDWATVDMTVMFQLTEPTTIRYSGQGFGAGQSAESRVYLNGNVGATFASNVTAELAPGTHWIRVRSTIQRSWIPDGPYGSSSAGALFVMTIPSPGVAVAGAPVMLLSLRRRR
jgi:hypothetical protein